MDHITSETAAWLESRRVVLEPVPDVIVGIGHALTHCRSVLGRLQAEANGHSIGGSSVRSMLFTGPSGTGKTLTARWLGAQLGPIPAYDLPPEQLTAERIREAFRWLATQPRSVVYLPEVDAIGLDRHEADTEARRSMFALLEALDGLTPISAGCGPILIATTNRHASELDPAVRRRLGTHILFGLPTTAERRELFRRFASPWAADTAISWDRLAEMSGRMTPADIRGVVDDALGLALLRDGQGACLEDADLQEAVRRAGEIQPDDSEPFADVAQVAVHEAGHVAVAIAEGVHVRSVHLGVGRRQARTETGVEGAVLTDFDLRAGVVVSMGGVMAEDVLCGNPTVGAESDVRRATGFVITRIEAGLDPDFPPVSRRAWGGGLAPTATDVLIAPRVMDVLADARQRAREIVVRDRDAIRAFADQLLEAVDLTGDALEEALASVGWRQGCRSTPTEGVRS